MVLVDTNIWVSAFRSAPARIVSPLSALLTEKQACITRVIRAELLSGARTENEFRFLQDKLIAVPVVEDPNGLWDSAAHARFRLARMGIQESLLDLSIACSAHLHRHPLWTEDKQFMEIQKVVSFRRFL